MNDDYLWDRGGDPDPELCQLENALAPLRLKESSPDFAELKRASNMSRLRSSLRPDFGTALALVVCVGLAVWFVTSLHQVTTNWEAQATAGSPTLGGRILVRGRVAPGTWLTTDKMSTAQIQSKNVGEVQVGADSMVSLAESSSEQQLLLLRYGNIHATVFSPPGLFVVDTPSAKAIDLGCEYTLRIDRDGRGELKVSSGWVSLNGDSQSLVPAGAMARIAPGKVLSPPYFVDGTPAFQQAAGEFAFMSADSPQRGPALQTILHDARQRDALTLLNLFSRAQENERLLIFDKLNQLVPAPAGITRETARNWQLNSMDAWWPVVQQALGLGEIKKGKTNPGQ